MPDFVSSPAFRSTVGLLVLCVIVAVAVRLVASYRDYADEDRDSGDDILSKLQEMHLKGDITDEEFRTMKAKTHLQLLEKTNDDSSNEPEESAST